MKLEYEISLQCLITLFLASVYLHCQVGELWLFEITSNLEVLLGGGGIIRGMDYSGGGGD